MQLSTDTINRIRQEMDLKNIRLKDMSVDTGIDPSNLSKYLLGKRPISNETLDKIARVLNVSENWLINGDEIISNYQNAWREKIYNQLLEVVTTRNISDNKLRLLKTLLYISEEDTNCLLRLVRVTDAKDNRYDDVEYAYDLADQSYLNNQLAEINRAFPPLSKEEEIKQLEEAYEDYKNTFGSDEDEKEHDEMIIKEWGSIDNYMKCIDATPAERKKIYLDPPLY